MGNSSLSSLKMRNSKVHALLYGYIARNGMTHTLVCGTFGARSFRVVQLRDFHRLWCVFFVIVGNSSSRVIAWDLERVCKSWWDFHCGKRRRFVFWHCSTTDLNFRVSSPFPLPPSPFPLPPSPFPLSPSPFPLPLPGRPLLSQATTLFQCELFVPLKKKRSRSNLRRLKSLFLLSDMVVTGQEMVKEK